MNQGILDPLEVSKHYTLFSTEPPERPKKGVLETQRGTDIYDHSIMLLERFFFASRRMDCALEREIDCLVLTAIDLQEVEDSGYTGRL